MTYGHDPALRLHQTLSTNPNNFTYRVLRQAALLQTYILPQAANTACLFLRPRTATLSHNSILACRIVQGGIPKHREEDAVGAQQLRRHDDKLRKHGHCIKALETRHS